MSKERKEIIKSSLEEIREHSKFFEYNEQKLDIFEGDLLKYVDEVLRNTVSPNYYSHIRHRLLPVNVLTRVIDKMSKVYSDDPLRMATVDSAAQWLEFMEASLSINMVMGLADSYSHLFKGYLLQPYIDQRQMRIRVIPYDRFLPIAGDPKKPEKMTAVVTIMGETDDGKKIYYYYDEERFIPFTSGGDEYKPALEGNDGVNPYGFIPFVYGNRAANNVVPQQDTDILQVSKMVPVMLSDLAGAIMFQCFTVIYGVNIKADNLEMSPNAFWSFAQDAGSDSPPQVGTIKPEADIDKVTSFIKDTFILWLETKGVRVGSIGSMDGGNAASGISKIIDEMDVYEIKKRQIQYFKKEEFEFWEKAVALNNYWVKSKEIDADLVPEDTKVITEFDEPRPEVTRETEVRTIKMEVDAGFLDRKTAIKKLYPDLTEDQVIERLENTEGITFNAANEDDNQNS